jgi:NAD(P)-dependent dehydrogenase (short-subunit alcohol dehydrogenase family)
LSLNNKKYVVIGAGGLLGLEVVSSLLVSGAEVIAVDIDIECSEVKIKARGVDVKKSSLTFYQLDITNERDVKAFFDTQADLDGAINCAYPRNKSYGAHFFDVSLESFNENVALNLGSSFLFSQQCAAYFVRCKKAFSLVNISSIYGVVAPKFNIYENTPMTMPVEYAAIKSALIHLNKYVTAYVNDSKFRMNSVSPGGILDGQPESFLRRYKDETLGQGMLECHDMVGAIKFLLSEDSKYINAQNIIVDDGFHL